MKTWGTGDTVPHTLLISALDTGEWSALPLWKEPPVPTG